MYSGEQPEQVDMPNNYIPNYLVTDVLKVNDNGLTRCLDKMISDCTSKNVMVEQVTTSHN